jgi:hypothetical protein
MIKKIYLKISIVNFHLENYFVNFNYFIIVRIYFQN